MDFGRVGLGLGLIAWGALLAAGNRRSLTDEMVRKNAELRWRLRLVRWRARRQGKSREEWLREQQRHASWFGPYVALPFFILWFAACVVVLIQGFRG